MLYYHSLLYPQIPNFTSTSAHQGLALFSYVLIAVVDIREKHLKLLLRKLTYMTWSISKVLFFINFIFLWFIRGKIIGKVTLKNTYLLINEKCFKTTSPIKTYRISPADNPGSPAVAAAESLDHHAMSAAVVPESA